ncbi:MAG: chemotaxis protein CheD [Bdellovibrionales bacterium]|nr:chemotaxis protein CheD [Bdellovibrionales bacterium]
MTDIHVRIAEVKLGVPGDTLRTCLGSCVGIVFIWREKKLCGLAHCFLPEGQDTNNKISAKYVNQGIESLMGLMKIKSTDVENIEVYIAGGANMMNQLLKSNKAQVGKHNLEATGKFLAQYGFRIKKSNTGQDTGIKIIVDCEKGKVEFVRLDVIDYDVMWKAS